MLYVVILSQRKNDIFIFVTYLESRIKYRKKRNCGIYSLKRKEKNLQVTKKEPLKMDSYKLNNIISFNMTYIHLA